MKSVLWMLIGLAACMLGGCSVYVMDPLFHDPNELLGDYGQLDIDLPQLHVSDVEFDLSSGFYRQPVDTTTDEDYSNYSDLAAQVADLTDATLVSVATNSSATDIIVRYYVSQRDDLQATNVADVATAVTTQTIPAGATRETLTKALTGDELGSIEDVLDLAADGEGFSFYVLAADGNPLPEGQELVIHEITIDAGVEANLISTE